MNQPHNRKQKRLANQIRLGAIALCLLVIVGNLAGWWSGGLWIAVGVAAGNVVSLLLNQ